MDKNDRQASEEKYEKIVFFKHHFSAEDDESYEFPIVDRGIKNDEICKK